MLLRKMGKQKKWKQGNKVTREKATMMQGNYGYSSLLLTTQLS